MRRITNRNLTPSSRHTHRMLRELQSTCRALSRQACQHQRPSHPPALFVSESGAARYLRPDEARARRPLSDTLTGAAATIRFCEEHFRPVIEQSLQEEFYILTLNSAHQVIRTHSVTVGLVNTAHVHAREVFRPAILDAATAIIAAHNHPPGDWKPSEADRRVTRSLIQSGRMLGIELLDHVVLARNGSWSFRDHAEDMFVP